jgi:hypothetical protein
LILALMKPSRVATRSSTRGTSRGVTVVTRTSGGGGPVCAGLREQAVEKTKKIKSAPNVALISIVNSAWDRICPESKKQEFLTFRVGWQLLQKIAHCYSDFLHVGFGRQSRISGARIRNIIPRWRVECKRRMGSRTCCGRRRDSCGSK